jgi:hypothetical protein
MITFLGIAAYVVSLVLGGVGFVALLMLTGATRGSLSDWEIGSVSYVLMFLFFGFVTSPLAFLGDRIIRKQRWPGLLSDAIGGAAAVASLLTVLQAPTAFPKAGWLLLIGEGAAIGALMGCCYWYLRGKWVAEFEEGVRIGSGDDRA